MRHRYTIGIDEAGRGPLAGPVAVGVFAVSEAFDMRALHGIRDSKALSEAARERWYETLSTLPHAHSAVGFASARMIDRVGIVTALRFAMRRALHRIDRTPDETLVLLDGSLYAPAEYVRQRTIVRGDVTEPLISAASVLAKVERDRYMVRLGRRYPEYDFARHKGYGTQLHREAIRVHGMLPLHRSTFCARLTSGPRVSSHELLAQKTCPEGD